MHRDEMYLHSFEPGPGVLIAPFLGYPVMALNWQWWFICALEALKGPVTIEALA